jgi:hypothetical protein
VQEALATGFLEQAAALGNVRKHRAWSVYTANLIQTVQRVRRRYHAVDKLRFLLYPAKLYPADDETIRGDDTGMRWLGEVNTPLATGVKPLVSTPANREIRARRRA